MGGMMVPLYTRVDRRIHAKLHEEAKTRDMSIASLASQLLSEALDALRDVPIKPRLTHLEAEDDVQSDSI